MTISKILNELKTNPLFDGVNVSKKIIYIKSKNDILTGFLFEKTKSGLYIWEYTQPLIFNEQSFSLQFSSRIKINGSYLFESFNIQLLEKKMYVLDLLPKSVDALVMNLSSKTDLSFEQKSDLYVMKIYLNAEQVTEDPNLDRIYIEHLSTYLEYDYQKENLEFGEKLVSLSIIERKNYFYQMIQNNNQNIGRSI